jgi:hypothetical protein
MQENELFSLRSEERKKISRVILDTQSVVERWGVIVKGAEGQAPDTVERIQALLKDSAPTGIQSEQVKAYSGFLQKLLAPKSGRDYLVVTNPDLSLSRYRIFLSVRDYGPDLDVAWLLTSPFTTAAKMIAASSKAGAGVVGIGLHLNAFQLEDLRAFLTVVHRSVREAVKELMDGLGQDFSQVSTHSKGFLEVW